MITLDDINKSYILHNRSIPAIRSINLTVKPGEIFGVIGKSGAGKSTLIRCVNLLETPDSGRVLVDGKDLMRLDPTSLRAARRKIGMIFQHFNLLSSRTVYHNVALPLELAGHSKQSITNTIMPLLELTELLDKKNAYPSQLSGGQKQRVAIARALASQPTILLSDEATSALDPETTLSILQLLKNIRDTLNLTILLITHEMNVVKTICDRVALLEKGTLIETNTVGEFFIRPQTSTAKNFIASAVLQHLPDAIQRHLLKLPETNAHPVLRLWFRQGTATQPIISMLSLQFNVHVNILQANIEYVQNQVMGIMIIVVKGFDASIQSAIEYLKEHYVDAEVLGYAPDNIAV